MLLCQPTDNINIACYASLQHACKHVWAYPYFKDVKFIEFHLYLFNAQDKGLRLFEQSARKLEFFNTI